MKTYFNYSGWCSAQTDFTLRAGGKIRNYSLGSYAFDYHELNTWSGGHGL